MEMRIDVFVVGEGYCFGEGMGCGFVVGHLINCYRFYNNLINRFIKSIKYYKILIIDTKLKIIVTSKTAS